MTDTNTFNFDNIGNLGGTTTENALEATAKSNEIFGGSSGANDLFAGTTNIAGATTNTNNFNGEKQLIPGTTIDTDQYFQDSQKIVDNAIDANALLNEVQKIPGASIDADKLLKKNAQNLAVTDGNTFFTDTQTIPGVTSDTAALFGNTETIPTLKATDTNTFFGTTEQPMENSLYGANPAFQGTLEDLKSFPLSKTNIVEAAHDISTEVIPSTGEFFGTTNILPETTNIVNQTGGVQKITTTTTKTTTYNTNQNLPIPTPIPTTFDSPLLPKTQNKYTQTTFSITGIPNTFSNLHAVGYGTMPEPIPIESTINTTTTTAYETSVIPPPTETVETIPTTTYTASETTFTTPIPTTQSTYIEPYPATSYATPVETTYVPSPAEKTMTTTTTRVYPKTETVTTQIKRIPVKKTVKRVYQTTQVPKVVTNQVIPTYSYAPPSQPQILQVNKPTSLVQTKVSPRIPDEDFRRGRPIYGNTKLVTSIMQPNNTLNMSIKPSYNVALENNPKFVNYELGKSNIGLNPLGTSLLTNNTSLGLDRLARGKSYDVYGRSINPLYNRVGITPATNNLSTSKIKDFL